MDEEYIIDEQEQERRRLIRLELKRKRIRNQRIALGAIAVFLLLLIILICKSCSTKQTEKKTESDKHQANENLQQELVDIKATLAAVGDIMCYDNQMAAAKLDELGSGTYVYLLYTLENEAGEQWTRVVYNGQNGYVMTKFLYLLTEEDSDAYDSVQVTIAPDYTLEDVFPPAVTEDTLATTPADDQTGADNQTATIDQTGTDVLTGTNEQTGTNDQTEAGGMTVTSTDVQTTGSEITVDKIEGVKVYVTQV